MTFSFDLENCPDSHPLGSPKRRCEKSGATISVTTKTRRYQAVLQRYVGQKGNSVWDVSGQIKEYPIQTAAKEKPNAPSPPQASSTRPGNAPAKDRAPAAVRGEAEAIQSEKVAETAPPVPTASPSPTPPSVSISGMLDLYYTDNFNHPPTVSLPNSMNPGLPTQSNQLRNFDLYNGQFGLNLAELTFKKTGNEVTFFTDLDFGQTADFVSRSSGVTDDVSKHIGQAVITYSPASVSGLSFSAGKMDTNMGYETTKATNNWQYSRSFLFSEGLPYWHLGADVSYAFVPNIFTVTGFVYNGWNSLYSDNAGKTFALQATWNASSSVALTYNGIYGPEQPNDTTDITQVHEFIATWNVSPTIQLASDTIYGWAGRSNLGLETAGWGASSLALKYQVLPRYSISPRIEFYRDIDGVTTGTAQNLYSFTLTQALKPIEGLEPRVEFRWDHSSSATFATTTGTSNNQPTLTFAVLYGF